MQAAGCQQKTRPFVICQSILSSGGGQKLCPCASNRFGSSIDLVERHRGGAVRVVDHKAGRMPDPRPETVGAGDVLQPALYAMSGEKILNEAVTVGRCSDDYTLDWQARLRGNHRSGGVMTYRREIDGLRALAVIPVLLFHAGFETFSGGFIGVDVFFVISGYLITSIILHDQHRDKFSLFRFYERRARRILPALFLVMAVTFIPAYAWMLPDELKNFGQSLLATTLFSNNILLALTSDYWAMASEFKPLLHTWSLGVEEQYYVFFPLLMILGWKLFRKHLAVVLGVAAILSFAAANWGSFNKPEFTFYLLPTRAWEILVGALAAFYMIGTKRAHTKYLLSELLGATGFCLIVASVFLVGRGHTSHGIFYLAAPTLGTALIILFSSENTVVGKILGWGPIVGVGLISYSSYLWHQPLFSLARVYSKEPPGIAIYCVLVVLTFILAYLTWRFIETPCRNREKVSRTAIFAFALVLSVAFAWCGFYLNRNYGIVSRIYDTSKVKAADLDKRIYNQRVFQKKKDNFTFDEQLKLLVVGNSFARDFVNMTTETFDVENVDIVYRDDFSNCIAPFANKTAEELYNAADVIVFASGDVTDRCLADNIRFTRERNKELFYIGTKDFGYNENWIMRLEPRDRSNQWNKVLRYALESDAKVSRSVPRDNYISLMKPIVRDGYIPITDADGRLISTDRAHVTKYGAIFYGQRVLLGSRYGQIMMKRGGSHLPTPATFQRW
jgi:peptidoglycan/LPS O-acetylase OafA/YrhL